ncbi:MAG: DUF1674 domain-containing protein [Steroidobacteraceae bacterium]
MPSSGPQSSSGSPSITNSNADGERHDDTAPAPQPSHGKAAERPREHGGRNGPEPTRFGDWEKAGRCIDF